MTSAVESTTPPGNGPSPTELNSNFAPEAEGKHNGTVRVAFYCALALLITAIGAFVVRSAFRKSAVTHSKSAVTTLPANSTIRLTGTTEAVRMRSIAAPVIEGEHLGMLTITKLVAAGAQARQGDVLAEFDRQAQVRNFMDKQAEYEDLANKVMEEQAKESAARAADETEIAAAQSTLSKAELEMQKLELLSRIDAEKNQQALEEAKATLKQLRATFDLKRQSAHAAIHLLELQRDRARQVMEHARRNSELMQIHAPITGVVVLNTIWKQGRMGEIQEGDQVRPGVTFMQVVDPSVMQVRASANQEDFLKLRLGQEAKVHLDAYPELMFAGKLEQMAPAAVSGDFSSKLRNFAVVFSLGGNDPKLMPDLSAAVDVNITTQAAGAGAFH